MGMNITLNTQYLSPFLAPDEMDDARELAFKYLDHIYHSSEEANVKGWVDCNEAAAGLELIKEKAKEIHENADVFILVGVGGSNQAAQAMIEALQVNNKPEIIYAGNTLSAHYLRQVLNKLDGKSIYMNVIAKNFETLEPGSHFRVLRQYMASRYSAEELAKRIIITGTLDSPLHTLAKKHHYQFLSFPLAIGGRFSAFSPVGLLPMAVAGLDITAFLNGGRVAQKELSKKDNNIAISYALARYLLYKKGYQIEVLASFEPQMTYFAKWWIQLFGESEGKDGKGLFPASAIYSEDLHSMGQYMQDGPRHLIETFISIRDPQASVIIKADQDLEDGFDYLNDKDFSFVNHAAEKATLQAHFGGGVPCIQLSVPKLSEEIFGQLYYFFMISCAISGKLLGVNPFDQEGVEAYKHSMFGALGK